MYNILSILKKLAYLTDILYLCTKIQKYNNNLNII